MSPRLPALTFAALPGWPAHPHVRSLLRQALLGQVLVLPAALGEQECAEIGDAVAVMADLPIEPVRAADAPVPGPRPCVVLEMAPVSGEALPSAIPQVLRLCLREVMREREGFQLEMPRELMLLRDMVIDHAAAKFAGTRLKRLPAWIGSVADSPSTALRFVEGSWRHWLLDEAADDSAIFAAGLAAVWDWLLDGVDPRVAAWVIACCTGRRDPARLVGTQAALLGWQAALKQAWTVGLLDHAPPAATPEGPVEFRRPLAVLGRLAEAPVEVHLDDVIDALKQTLGLELGEVIERAYFVTVPQLGLQLDMPMVSMVVGRDQVLERLVALFTPSPEIRTWVLYGRPGIGKTATAAALARVLAADRETVWVSFADGPEAGWRRVATTLPEATQRRSADGDGPDDAPDTGVTTGLPGWVERVHTRLARTDCLVVIDDVGWPTCARASGHPSQEPGHGAPRLAHAQG